MFSSSRLAAVAARSLSMPSMQYRTLYQSTKSQQAIITDNASSGHTSQTSPSPSPSSSSPSPSYMSPRTEFDPPAQISRINTHFCREPQLIMIEGYGILQGQMDPSRLLTKYLNVPFATIQDPTKHAVAPESWRGIRDATMLGPMCPQDVQRSNSLTTMMLGLPGPGFEYSERDCLNLNVFAPRCVEHVPVICYIHGGLSQGGNALPKNDATNIVKTSIAKGTPVVVVTVNYRLLPSAGLLESSSSDNEDEEKVDWGLHDQKIALDWVRKHIHNFGGNPNEITLMGHSSGASSAGYHLLTTAAQQEGLFKRAIMHSCSTSLGGETKNRREMEVHDEQQAEAGLAPQQHGSPLVSTHYATKASGKQSWKAQGQMSIPATQGAWSEDEDITDVEDGNAQFTFMSDACMPYMSERERQAGFRVIDRWIDFAWGKQVDSGRGQEV